MFQPLFRIRLLFAAPEGNGSGTAMSDLSKSDILDYLNKDDDDEKDVIPLEGYKEKADRGEKDDKKAEKEEKEDDEETDETDEEDKDEDELKELEEELEDPDEEKLELTTPTSRREILKKYPKIFKDFPYLETAYYREQEFTKIHPTIKDARESAEKSKTLDNFENDLTSGNTETILKAVKTNNPKAFDKIVDDYLATLARVDEKSYHHVLGNTIKHTIITMLNESRASGNEVLEQAAQILNQFVFGSSKFTSPTRLSSEDKQEENTKEREIEEREKSFAKRKFESTNEELSSKVNKAYRLTIENRIDPKDSMSEYVKKTAVREAMEELEGLLAKDQRFKVLIDKLWERAFKEDFSETSISKIRSAFVSKAQTLLPSVIQKSRNNALRGMGKRVVEKDDDSRPNKESNKRQESSRNRDSDESPRGSKKVPSEMSSLEYLMSDD
jgi:hypothetical protein